MAADIVAVESRTQQRLREASAVAQLQLLNSLIAEFNPQTPVEMLLVEEAARCVEQARECQAAINALRQEGEAALVSAVGESSDSRAASAVALATVCGSAVHETILRQSLTAFRGFTRAIGELSALRAEQTKHAGQSRHYPDSRFRTEQACVAYLLRRYDQGVCGCRRCGSLGCGCFIAARLLWECGRCKAQTSLRRGTCMEGSPLSLTSWFAAIRVVLWNPGAAPAELQSLLQINRAQTVRSVVTKIKRAIESDNASALLAGLDQAYLFST